MLHSAATTYIRCYRTIAKNVCPCESRSNRRTEEGRARTKRGGSYFVQVIKVTVLMSRTVRWAARINTK
jgi:hypothetical protein